MSTITFDTHKFVKDLRDAGMPEPQAEAFVRAIKNGEKPLSDLADVRNTLKIIFGAYESNRNNKVIQLS